MSDALHVHAELSVLEAEVMQARIAQQVRDGLIPPTATRPILPHERFATFAAYDRDQRTLAEQAAAILLAMRALFGRRLVQEFTRRAHTQGAHAAIAWLLDVDTLGLALVPGTPELVAATEARIARVLSQAAVKGVESIVAEAARQGVTPPAGLTIPTRAVELEPILAKQSATQTVSTVVRRTVDAVTKTGTTDAGELVKVVEKAVESAPDAGVVTDQARVPVVREWSIARLDTIPVLPDVWVYHASELLDQHGCPPCSVVDGTTYDTLDQAKRDYPDGLYRGCQGGSRCRGTLVIVHRDTEDRTAL